jgi:hypothetical protein
MSKAALAYIREEHDLDRVAESYTAVLEQMAGAPVVESKIIHAVAEAAAVTRIDASALAPELAELGLVSPNGRVQVSDTRTRLLGIWPMWAWLGLLYVAAVSVHLALGLRVVSPWIMVDELIYSDLARSCADTGHFLIRGAHANYGLSIRCCSRRHTSSSRTCTTSTSGRAS